MRGASAHPPGNALFIVAAAEALPAGLDGAVSERSIYFPWGSLLHPQVGGLVAPSPRILDGIARAVRPGGTLRSAPRGSSARVAWGTSDQEKDRLSAALPQGCA